MMWGIFTLFSLFFVAVFGSKIRLTSSPTTVQPSLTKYLNISCSLHDTSLPPGAIIGRSLTNTSYDVTHVISILIMRNGTDVASITPYTPALASLQNVTVSGLISANSDTKGYLNISWTWPTEQELGEFVCEMHAIDATTGHGVVFSTSIQVSAVDSTVNDLKQIMKQMETRVSGLETELQNFSGMLAEVNKTEGGSIHCGGSGYSSSGYWQSKYITVYFSSNYTRAPIVHLSLMYVDDNTDNGDGYNKDNEFGVDIISVSSSSFKVRCFMYHWQTMQDMKAGWFSFPQL